MEREQIIKALECCASGVSLSACMSGCPLYKREDSECFIDNTALPRYALSLIKELTEENERLRVIPEQLHKEMSERMVEERKIERKLAVRKMQSLLHEEAYIDGDELAVLVSDIDQNAKEILLE